LGCVTDVTPKVIDYGNPEIDKPKCEFHRLNGWGFKDTKITYDRHQGCGKISGTRYSFSGSNLKTLPNFCEKEVNLSLNGEPVPCQDHMLCDPAYVNEKFLAEIEGSFSRLSFENDERVMHSHCHTLHVFAFLIHLGSLCP
jgi:hypothetical protein